jgi:hypothetical protein
MGKSDALNRQADPGSGLDDNWDITPLTPNFFVVWAGATEGLEVIGEERDLLRLI